ncbi:methyltransferase domain-containing protein [Cytophagaceae bacterium ABcell3]|nr:methyltransferase domain-containing protein [Cytophagaceae bacterium ABcell3]
MTHDKEYWEKRYADDLTGWDTGAATPPIKNYIDQLTNKDISILVPGCGNAWEAEYIYTSGFKNVFLLDIAEAPLKNFQARMPEFPAHQLVQADFFKYSGAFDLIIEQTFFCALSPSLRQAYAEQCHALLRKGGKLVGVLFNDELNKDKPPYGGSKEEYIDYFSPLFNINVFETCYNSIPPRAGRELFISLTKK